MLDKLPYLGAFCKEVLRLYAPLPVWGRFAGRDTEINGFKIPKGTTVRATTYAINQARHLWGEDAREFNPERWLSRENKTMGGAKDSIAFMTFGHGTRVCIGKSKFFRFKFLGLNTDY
jgi:cytochrome P450